jgi:hypothetical protein
MKQHNVSKQKWLGFGAGLLLRIFGRKPKSDSTEVLYKKDFHPSTQKMGLRFSERIRNTFRHQWLRRYLL